MPIIKITCFEPSFTMISSKRMTASNNLSVKVRSPLKADTVKITRFRSGLFAPVLGPLLQSRWIIVLLAAVISALVALTAMGITVWQCPVRSTLGVLCPGCGLTRAMVLLIQGHWHASLHTHAFAPIFLMGVMVLTIISITPKKFQKKATRWTTEFEKRTGVVAVLMMAMLTYWIFRILHLV